MTENECQKCAVPSHGPFQTVIVYHGAWWAPLWVSEWSSYYRSSNPQFIGS